MDDKPSPDDTLPDEQYFDTLAEMESLDFTYSDFPALVEKPSKRRRTYPDDE